MPVRPFLLSVLVMIISCVVIQSTEEVIGTTLVHSLVRKENETIRIRRAIKNPFKVDQEALMSTPDLIVNRGYPVETHKVITSDGYILELHRIPSGNKGYQYKGKPVLILHGLMATSRRFVMLPSDSALGFMLANKGYDVWLINFRGNSDSREHVHLDPSKDDAYWDFSFDETGKYDVTATMQYISKQTGRDKMSVICHCAGCSSLFIALVTYPQLNDQCEVVVSIAPSVRLGYYRAPFLRHFIFRFYEPVKFFVQIHLRLIGKKNFGDLVSDGILKTKLKEACYRKVESYEELNRFCAKSLYNLDYFKSAVFGIIPIVDRSWPTGSSVKILDQYYQNNKAKEFNAFDYGPEKNLKFYGTEEPLSYNLKLVTAPVFLIWSTADPMGTERDVKWLEQSLGNCKGSFQTKEPLGHFGFIWGDKVKEIVNEPILKLLPPAF